MSNEEEMTGLYEETYSQAEASGGELSEEGRAEWEKQARALERGKRLAGEYAGH